MFKYLGNILQTALPSVLATVLGAYIVNQYINKPTPPAPPAVIVVDPKKAEDILPPAAPAKNDAKATAPTEASTPEVTTKSKSVIEKPSPEKAPAPEKAVVSEKPVQEKPAVRHQPIPRDKSVTKAPGAPATSVPVTPAATPILAPATAPAPATNTASPALAPTPTPTTVTAPMPTPATAATGTMPAPALPAEGPTKIEPDANDLARAAIERARASDELNRTPEPAPQIQERGIQPEPGLPPSTRIEPLPPAVTVTPPGGSYQTEPSEGPVVRPQRSLRPTKQIAPDGLSRPTPPADIPETSSSPPNSSRSSVGDDVLSTAKSVIQSVIPR